MRNRKIFFIIIMFVFMVFSHGYAQIKVPFGHVTTIKGKPKINKKNARVRQKVFVGDIIITDLNSSLCIKTKKGDTFYVGPESRVLIMDKKDVKIERGTFRSIIHKLKPNEAFNVISKGGVAGVKGTEFVVYAKGGATAVFTKKGWVSLENQEESVITRAKHMSQSAKGVTPIAPVNYEKDQSLKRMFHTLMELTSLKVPPEMKKMKELPDIIARWNINYTEYLVDKKKYTEAIKVLEIAFFFASIKDIKAEALFQRSMVITRFFKNYSQAIEDLENIIKNYSDTKFYESALFQRGFIEFERKNYKECKKYFIRYKEEFPKGKYIPTIEVLLNEIP